MSEEEERVTAESYGALDITEATDECWILRCPQKLWETINELQEGSDIGELIFTKGGTDETGKKVAPKLNVRVAEDVVPQGTNLPLNYSLQAMSKKIPRMHPFVRNPNNGSVKLLGTVSRTANLQVEQDSSYRALIKDRLVATNITSNRYVKPAETMEADVSHQTKGTSSFGSAIHRMGQRILEAKQETKAQQEGPAKKKSRQFAPDQPLRSVIFELFQHKQFWTVKDLKMAAAQGGCDAAATKRADTEVRDILREIGDYHRSGEHKNEWELKSEYKQQS